MVIALVGDAASVAMRGESFKPDPEDAKASPVNPQGEPRDVLRPGSDNPPLITRINTADYRGSSYQPLNPQPGEIIHCLHFYYTSFVMIVIYEWVLQL